MKGFLTLILICLLVGCCWYWFSHANEVDPKELPTSTYLSDKPEDKEAVKKKTDEMPDWPVWICIIFIATLSLGVIIPNNIISLVIAVICCLILIFTGHYMYICLGLLLQIIIIPMGILAFGKMLLGGD
jgi:hypothetical protein